MQPAPSLAQTTRAPRTLALLITLVLGCGGETTGPSPVPDRLQIVAGGGQSGTVNQRLRDTLMVRVRDQRGNPMGRVDVEWVVPASYGSVAATVTPTDADGIARVVWTLGRTAGAQSLAVRVKNAPACTQCATEFGATATPDRAARFRDAPDSLHFTARDDSTRVAVVVTDQFDNAVTTAAQLSLTPGTSVATLQAGGWVKARAAGTTWLRLAADTARDSVPVVVKPVVAKIRVCRDNALTACRDTVEEASAGISVRLVAQRFDRNNYELGTTEAPIQWSSLDPAVAELEDANGLVRLRALGRARVVAQVQDKADTMLFLVGAPQLARVAVAHNGAAVSQLSIDALNDTVPLSAKAYDQFDRLFSGATVAWTSSDTAVLRALPDGRLVSRVTGSVVVTASASSGGSSQSAPVAVQVRQVPASVSVVPATVRLQQSETIPLTATVRDSRGTLIPGVAVTWSSTRPATASVDAATGVVTAVDVVGSVDIQARPTGASNVVGVGKVEIAGGVQRWRVLAGEHSGTTCGLLEDGTAYCWFDNNAGQSGTGSFTPAWRDTPQRVAGNLKFDAISVADWHVCGLTKGVPEIWCWGWNANGQLGADPTGMQQCSPPSWDVLAGATTPCASTPVRVTTSLPFAAVGAGFAFTCALTTDGKAYCWGRNDAPQLGRGASSDARAVNFTPQPVAGGLTFVSLTVGRNHACGLTAAGTAHCWGANWLGQLGSGTTDHTNVPVEVQGGLRFRSMHALRDGTCGITTDGRTYCWGASNEYGQMGNGTVTPPSTPQPVPNRVQTSAPLVTVRGAWQHTCGLTAAGEAYCWGRDTHGQLGDGPGAPEHCVGQPGQSGPCASVPVRVAGGLRFKDILPRGYGLSTCGLTIEGRMFCWGAWNEFGVVGTPPPGGVSHAPMQGPVITATSASAARRAPGIVRPRGR